VWGFNQAVLGLVDLVGQFHRLLVSDGFRPAIDAVAEGMLGISRPVFTMGLTLACLFLILLPVGRLLDLVNTRKLIALMLLVPVLFVGGTAGTVFQDLEHLRLDIATLLYDEIFTGSRPQFASLGQPATGSGQTQDLCPLVPWNPDVSPALHGDAIAAAYLCATRQDVLDPESTVPGDLPDAFAERYFALGAAEFASADPAQREQQIATAASGVGRMAYGVFLTLFALTEALTNLLWTLGLGTLVIALTLVPLLVVVFARLRVGQWLELSPELRNSASRPSAVAERPVAEISAPVASPIGSGLVRTWLAVGVLALAVWVLAEQFRAPVPPVVISRNDAARIAREALVLAASRSGPSGA